MMCCLVVGHLCSTSHLSEEQQSSSLRLKLSSARDNKQVQDYTLSFQILSAHLENEIFSFHAIDGYCFSSPFSEVDSLAVEGQCTMTDHFLWQQEN
jgi:hypothetical protein